MRRTGIAGGRGAAAALAALIAAGLLAGGGAWAQPGVPAMAGYRYLDPVAFAPDHLVAPPPAPGSADERIELETVRATRAAASPARRAQAAWDGDHEEPAAVFSAAAGRDLAKLPATLALLREVQDETERVTDAGKALFHRQRPYALDPALDHCGKAGATQPAKPTSYPSGHAGFGWAVGWALARLLPARAPQLIARAEDYALSREVCAVHFPRDVAASHAIGVLVAEALLADPRLADKRAAARAELAQH